jgi:hypothetical protein
MEDIVKSRKAPMAKERSLASRSINPKPTGKAPSVRKGTASKQHNVLALLRQAEGTTIAAIVKATGWQPHSVRGFLAGVVRKKLKLNLQSDKIAGSRVYRISDKPPIKTKGLQSKSASSQAKTDERRPIKRRSA